MGLRTLPADVERRLSSLPRWAAPAAAATLVAAFLATGLYDAAVNSGTCDELGAHIPCGWLYCTSGRFSGGIGNFPLGQVLIALPAAVLGRSYELYTEQHLLLFRLPVLILGALLGGVVYRFASDLLGRGAALVALLLLAGSPNVLAHASLATLDLPAAFFIFLAVYALHRYVDAPGVARMALLSVALAAAMVVKVQALLLIALAGLAGAVFFRQMLPAGRRERVVFFASWLLIPVVALVVINLVYLHLPTRTGDLLPGPFLEAVRKKLGHSERGHFTYLLGRYSETGWWYYFPVAIALKTPLPTLILAGVGLCRRHGRKVVVFVLVPAAALLAAGMTSRINIGLRHVLGVYPFLFVLAGAGAARLWRPSWRGALPVILLGGCAAWAVWIPPHHLSYFNLLAGGPANGHRCLLDSNFDWGQNDRFLRRHVARTRLAYQINPDPYRPTGGHVLVNANARYGVLIGGPRAYRWLRRFRPTDQIAYTWFEYHLPEAAPAAPPGRALRPKALAYLLDLRDRHAGIARAEYRLGLARSLAALRAYDLALDEVRSVLSRDPTCEAALSLGGRLIVRHKLGVLRYSGEEYLKGFHTPRPAGPAPGEAEAVRLARSIGLAGELSKLHAELGEALRAGGDRRGAAEAFRRALRFDSANGDARARLRRLTGQAGR